MEPSLQNDSGIKELLQQLLDAQRQQLATISQAAQTLADQQHALRRQRRAAWLMILISFLLLGIGVGLMAQIEWHARQVYQLWDETFPLDDPAWDEDSGQDRYNETDSLSSSTDWPWV